MKGSVENPCRSEELKCNHSSCQAKEEFCKNKQATKAVPNEGGRGAFERHQIVREKAKLERDYGKYTAFYISSGQKPL